jgi:hypothetical protein
VNQAGTYRIEVTHISDDNGEVVEAEESARFEIEPMVITVVDITPGMIGLMRIDRGPPPEPIEVGRTYAMPQEAGLDFRWLIEGQPGLHDIVVDAPGTLTITRYDPMGIAGIVDLGPVLTGSFDVSYWEQWEPE